MKIRPALLSFAAVILLTQSAWANFQFANGMGVGSAFILLKDLPPGTTRIENGVEVTQFDPNIAQVAISQDPRVPTVASVPRCEITSPKHVKAGTKLKMQDGSAGGIALDYELSKHIMVTCNYPPTEETVDHDLMTRDIAAMLGGYFFIVGIFPSY